MQKVIKYPEIGEMVLSRTRRARRITLSVKPDGAVRLSFPVWVTLKRALKFVDEKAEWIAEAQRKMAEKYPELANRKAGEGAGGTGGTMSGETAAEAAARTEEEKRTRKRAVEALRAEAKARLPEMVARLAARHGFKHGTVKIKATRSRWGSCTARNDINLSMSLAALPEHLAEYIILHELCHTVHKNHSARFHALLDEVTGGRSGTLNKELRKWRPDLAMAAGGI